MSHTEKVKAEFLVIINCFTEGLFPVVANFAAVVFPPLLFHTTGAAIASISFIGYSLVRKGSFYRLSREEFLLVFATGLFTVGIPFALIFIGTQMTSGINTALLIQWQLPLTFLVGGIFLSERWLPRQIIGAAIVLIGTVIVLFNGSVDLNLGDLIILIGVSFFPIGNTFAKKALAIMPPSVVLMYRYIFGTLILLPITFFYRGNMPLAEFFTHEYFWLVVLYGLLILTFSKAVWYQALRKLPLAHAIAIASATPAVALFFAFIFLREIPTPYQWVGFVLTVSGVYMMISWRAKPGAIMSDPV